MHKFSSSDNFFKCHLCPLSWFVMSRSATAQVVPVFSQQKLAKMKIHAKLCIDITDHELSWGDKPRSYLQVDLSELSGGGVDLTWSGCSATVDKVKDLLVHSYRSRDTCWLRKGGR